jgi:RNA polymerase sigma-70 factor (ECF subfamily)
MATTGQDTQRTDGTDVRSGGADGTSRRAQFERLALPALDMLYRQAMKYTNNPDDAEDLVQDTFERGYKAFDSFKKGTNIEAWLTVILRNTSFNTYQKKKRRPRRANDATGEYNDWDLYDLSNHSGTGLKSAEQEYLSDSVTPEIINALNALPPERRRVFISAAIDGKSYKQVAQEEGIKIGTVMSRLNRARRQLREALADLAPTSSDPSSASSSASSRASSAQQRASASPHAVSEHVVSGSDPSQRSAKRE